MGVHHYKLDIVPEALAIRYLDKPHEFDLNEVEPFEHIPPPQPLLARLRNMLPRENSWGPCEEFETGDKWGSDLRILHDREPRSDSPVMSIQFRYSALVYEIELLKAFLGIVSDHGHWLYSVGTGQFLKPEFEGVLADFKQTDAFRALDDFEGAMVDAASAVKRPKYLG